MKGKGSSWVKENRKILTWAKKRNLMKNHKLWTPVLGIPIPLQQIYKESLSINTVILNFVSATENWYSSLLVYYIQPTEEAKHTQDPPCRRPYRQSWSNGTGWYTEPSDKCLSDINSGEQMTLVQEQSWVYVRWSKRCLLDLRFFVLGVFILFYFILF
jgi:hypothetical protein